MSAGEFNHRGSATGGDGYVGMGTWGRVRGDGYVGTGTWGWVRGDGYVGKGT